MWIFFFWHRYAPLSSLQMLTFLCTSLFSFIYTLIIVSRFIHFLCFGFVSSIFFFLHTRISAIFPLQSPSRLIPLSFHLLHYSLTPVHSVQAIVCLRSVAGTRPRDNLGTRVWCQEPLHPLPHPYPSSPPSSLTPAHSSPVDGSPA